MSTMICPAGAGIAYNPSARAAQYSSQMSRCMAQRDRPSCPLVPAHWDWAALAGGPILCHARGFHAAPAHLPSPCKFPRLRLSFQPDSGPSSGPSVKTLPGAGANTPSASNGRAAREPGRQARPTPTLRPSLLPAPTVRPPLRIPGSPSALAAWAEDEIARRHGRSIRRAWICL